MSYHNLCQDAKTPSGIASLFGMGLQLELRKEFFDFNVL
jgi:hypothetical protein